MTYQFVGEDDDVFKVKHPDGSEFHIAKSGVGPEMQKRIKGLSPIKMAEGGEVPDLEGKDLDIVPATDMELGRSPAQMPPNPLFIEPVSSPEMQNLGPTEQVGPPLPPPPIPVNQNLSGTPQVPNPAADYANAFAQKESGITQIADAQAKASEDQSKAYQENVRLIANTQREAQNKRATLDIENEELKNAYLNQKLDPNRVWKNASTGNKVLAAISVALSGIGSGLSGQPNMAMSVINKAIERDMESQRAEIGKTHTLLSENVRKYGDLNTATQATLLHYNALTQAKIQQAAAMAGTAQAQGQAKILLSDLGLQAAQMKQNLAFKEMAMKGGDIDPAALVPRIVPEHHQKQVFDEIQRAQDTRRMGDSILKSFDQAAKENTILRTGGYGSLQFRTPGSVLALHQSMQPTFKDLEGTVRQAAMDNTFKNITPEPGDTQHKIEQKRKALEEYLQSKASAPTAKGFGIDLDKFGSTTTHRDEIKTMGGSQYKKVNGGWQEI
jgi:hypothetical protein